MKKSKTCKFLISKKLNYMYNVHCTYVCSNIYIPKHGNIKLQTVVEVEIQYEDF